MINYEFRSTTGSTVEVRLAGPSPLDDVIIKGVVAGQLRFTQVDARHLYEALGKVLGWDGTEVSDAPT